MVLVQGLYCLLLTPHAKQTQILTDLGISFSNKRVNVAKKFVKQVKCCPVKIDITKVRNVMGAVLIPILLAPQSGALRISAYRDFHPIPIPYPYPIHL